MSSLPSMSEARVKGAGTRGGSTLQECYFRLSSASAEQVRLRAQLDQLRSKERQTLRLLEALTQRMSRLRAEVEHHDKAKSTHRGNQPDAATYGSSAWDEIELQY